MQQESIQKSFLHGLKEEEVAVWIFEEEKDDEMIGPRGERFVIRSLAGKVKEVYLKKEDEKGVIIYERLFFNPETNEIELPDGRRYAIRK